MTRIDSNPVFQSEKIGKKKYTTTKFPDKNVGYWPTQSLKLLRQPWDTGTRRVFL